MRISILRNLTIRAQFDRTITELLMEGEDKMPLPIKDALVTLLNESNRRDQPRVAPVTQADRDKVRTKVSLSK